MTELLISETSELEKYIRAKVAEGEGSGADESASSYFGHSNNLEKEVKVGRLNPEEAARLRYISALCSARKVSEIVLNRKICRAELNRIFAQYRQRVGNHEIHNVDNN